MKLLFVLCFLVLHSISFASPELGKQFQSLKPLTEAPSEIQKKASSVFQLQNGTASLISYEGKSLVMTNSHILGSKNCPLSGCEVSVFIDKKGAKLGKAYRKIFLLPYGEEIKADVAFFLVKDSKALDYITPLRLSNRSRGDLMGSAVFAVGFPRLVAKKFSNGVVVAKKNGWLRGSYFSLPGSSGSPILDSKGEVVGIHHRALPKLDVMTPSGFLYSGIFTPSQRIVQILEGFKDGAFRVENLFVDVEKATTLKTVNMNNGAFLGSGVRPLLRSGKSFSEALVTHCLRSTDLVTSSFPKFVASTASCQTLTQWLNCRSKKMHLFCPKISERKKVRKMYVAILNRHKGFDSYNLAPFLHAISRSYDNRKKGDKRALGVASTILTKYDIKGSYRLMGSLIGFAHKRKDLKFDGLDLLAEVKGYKEQVAYTYQLVPIIRSLGLLKRKHLISDKSFNLMMTDLGMDPSIPLGARLALEKNTGVVDTIP